MPIWRGGIERMTEPAVDLRRVGLLCALFLLIIGLVGTMDWATGLAISDLFSGTIPPAPLAIATYILLSIIIFTMTIPLRRTCFLWTARIINFLLMGATIIVCIEHFIDPEFDFQKLLLSPFLSDPDTPATHIAPLATVGILLGTIAISRIMFSKRMGAREGATVGAIGMLVSFMGILSLTGYLYGAPQLYGGIDRPISIASSLGLVFLGLSIITLLGLDKWPLTSMFSDRVGDQLMRTFLPLIMVVFLSFSWLLTKVVSTSASPLLLTIISTIVILVVISVMISILSRRIEDRIDRVESEKIQALEDLKQANEKLTILDSLTRHDIMNQISVSASEAELVKRYTSERKVIDSVNNIMKINKTITELLRFSKDYKQIGVEKPKWLSLREVISNAVFQIDLGKIAIDTYCEDWKVHSDPMIEKAFYNLIENSIRHGERATKILINCSLPEKDGPLKITVSDDGVGIPMSEKDRIFAKGVGKNTGLGLFLVRQILGITGISITENGIPGKGARFEISVPKGAYEAILETP